MDPLHDPPMVNWTLVTRYLGDELSSGERGAFERWIGMEPRRREEMALIRRLWDEAAAIPNAASVDRMWQTLRARLGLPAFDREAGVTSVDDIPRQADR